MPTDYADPAAYAADIPHSLAMAAHNGTSWVPETRAASTLAGWAESMASTFRMLRDQHCGGQVTPTLLEEWTRYHARALALERAYLSSRTGFVSAWIAGPSKYPAARMAKRHRVIAGRMNACVEHKRRALAAIVHALHPERRPIMAGDADALERLHAKLAKAQQLQDIMRRVNAAMRAHRKAGPDEQVRAMAACGVSESRARELLTPDCCGRLGFADYELRNNGAEIRRLEARIAEIEQRQALPAVEHAPTAMGIRVEEDPQGNRVRIYFPGKPDEATRDELKANGFRWSPSLGAWSGYHNLRTLAFCLRLGVANAARITSKAEG